MNRFSSPISFDGFGEDGPPEEPKGIPDNVKILIDDNNLLCSNACTMTLEGKPSEAILRVLTAEYARLREVMHWERGWSGLTEETQMLPDPEKWAKSQPPYRLASQLLDTGRIPQNLWIPLLDSAKEYAVKVAEALKREAPAGTISSIIQQKHYLGIHWLEPQGVQATT